MSTIKKRQHYVWRNYLRGWADKKDHIWALKKDENKILHPELTRVAQENISIEFMNYGKNVVCRYCKLELLELKFIGFMLYLLKMVNEFGKCGVSRKYGNT